LSRKWPALNATLPSVMGLGICQNDQIVIRIEGEEENTVAEALRLGKIQQKDVLLYNRLAYDYNINVNTGGE
jgi:hypothetical protein